MMAARPGGCALRAAPSTITKVHQRPGAPLGRLRAPPPSAHDSCSSRAGRSATESRRWSGVPLALRELGASPADQHYVHGYRVVLPGKRQPGQILADIPAAEQQAPGARVMVLQVGGGEDRRGENVTDGHGETRLSQCAGDRCPGPGCGVRDQGQRERSRAQPLQRRDRPGQRLPRDGQHAIDVDQHRADGSHAVTITQSPATLTRATGGCCQAEVSGRWPVSTP